ncbi:hypothetical protein ATM17_30745 (plasmid) [Sphingopyxis macrogoltabida]|uniref:Uncharacterized protein n=1 Tax=Sphingopyxis macrogoltabida TaxID=33050 RepID=A0AAC9FHI5_SPHMC|nr:hypothetical protein LH19_26750 [Sphingopyxis macrogoltabida]AMU92638.1 hypothetical protein ATM17_30745 [Sphingopyxis macrogoltabida]
MHCSAAIDRQFAGNALIRPDDKAIENAGIHARWLAMTITSGRVGSGRRIWSSQPKPPRTVTQRDVVT